MSGREYDWFLDKGPYPPEKKMTIKTPEPAFPRSYGCDGHNGMSLRDYFAGQAIAGGVCFEQEDGCIRTPEDAAELAYKFADAMMKAREQ